MRKNDILTLTCETLGADMEGVCRADGMAVFVPGMLPGETAPVRIVKDAKRYAFGKLEDTPVKPAEIRREPDCPVYPRCGGCSCRHMRYEATLDAKRQQADKRQETAAVFADEETVSSELAQDVLRGVIMSEILTRPFDRRALQRNRRSI